MSTPRFVLGCLLVTLSACFGPSYAGGPTSDEPHGVVRPGPDITVWRVDGYDTATRSGDLLLSPGRHKLKVRIEFPIESEAAEPREYRDVTLEIAADTIYQLSRGEGEYPPYELVIKKAALR